MAQTLTASAGSSAEEPIRSARRREYVLLQGASSAANDTSQAYTLQFLSTPARVEGGAVIASFSGRTATFTALTALGNNSVGVWVSE